MFPPIRRHVASGATRRRVVAYSEGNPALKARTPPFVSFGVGFWWDRVAKSQARSPSPTNGSAVGAKFATSATGAGPRSTRLPASARFQIEISYEPPVRRARASAGVERDELAKRDSRRERSHVGAHYDGDRARKLGADQLAVVRSSSRLNRSSRRRSMPSTCSYSKTRKASISSPVRCKRSRSSLASRSRSVASSMARSCRGAGERQAGQNAPRRGAMGVLWSANVIPFEKLLGASA